MKKIAVIGAILEKPGETQAEFNRVVSASKAIVKGRMGLPIGGEAMAVIAITIAGTMDEINAFTGRLGKIPHVTVSAAISKKEIIKDDSI